MGAAPLPRDLKLIGGRGRKKDGQEIDVAGRPIPPDRGWKRCAPTKPDDMSDVASDLWDRIVPEMARIRLLKEEDASALEMGCEAYANFVRAREIIKVEGVVIPGSASRNPAVMVFEGAQKAYHAFCHEFGLTPSAEMRVKTPLATDDGGEDPFG